jgi:hypothetical protein
VTENQCNTRIYQGERGEGRLEPHGDLARNKRKIRRGIKSSKSKEQISISSRTHRSKSEGKKKNFLKKERRFKGGKGPVADLSSLYLLKSATAT